jgi:hypothetical protein
MDDGHFGYITKKKFCLFVPFLLVLSEHCFSKYLEYFLIKKINFIIKKFDAPYLLRTCVI